MFDFGTRIQQVVLDALTESADRPQADLLADLRPALKSLRKSYRSGEPPAFDAWEVRAAYALAYFPHHAAAAAAAFDAAGRAMLGLGRHTNVLVLGAGPGPEVIGLVEAMGPCQPDTGLTFHLVDREPGWRRSRRATIEAVLSAIPSTEGCDVNWHEHEMDLAASAGLAALKPLVQQADLVVCETLLTELPNPGADGQLIDRLGDWLGPEGRLLVIDVDIRRDNLAGSRARLGDRGDLIRRLQSRQRFPAAAPIAPLASHLYSSNEDGLIRRKCINLDLFLYSRPAACIPRLEGSTGFDPNSEQRRALDAIASFLRGNHEIFMLTGAAGTGKTALFSLIAEQTQCAGLPVQLMAPTGQAARRLTKVAGLGASTIHSAIYVYEGTEFPDSGDTAADDAGTQDFRLQQPEPQASKKADRPPVIMFQPRKPAAESAIYLIDEASLIGNRVAADEDVEVLFAEGKLLSDLVDYTLDAHGSKLVLVGDKEQLPPIGDTEPVALTTDKLAAITGRRVVTAELTEVVRQGEGTRLLDLAVAARGATTDSGLDVAGFGPDSGVNLLSGQDPASWLYDAFVRGEAIVVAARNQDVGEWNRRIRRAVGRPARMPVRGDRLNVVRRNSMFELLNGDDLMVEEVSERTETVSLKEDRVTLREAKLQYEQPGVGPILFSALLVEDLLSHASQKAHSKVTQILFVDFKLRTKLKPGTKEFSVAYADDARVNALRVNYSYARTCHRAQGGEWPFVLVDFRGYRSLGPTFGRWAYTAVTRAKRGVWLANLPRSRAPMGADALVGEASRLLAASGFEMEGSRAIQHGVQLTVSRDGECGRFNLFEKKGRPSRLVLTGAERPSFTESVIAIFNEWTEQEATGDFVALPQAVEETAAAAHAELQQQGYDLEYGLKADYQVEFRISANGESARAVYYFNSDGRLTAAVNKEGDLDLLGALTEALDI